MSTRVESELNAESVEQVVTLHVATSLTDDVDATVKSTSSANDEGPLSLLDGMRIVWARESSFDLDDGLKSMEFAVAQRSASFAKSDRLPQIREAALQVYGVQHAEWENDDVLCSLGVKVAAGLDPADVLLSVGEALRAEFGPPTWYNVHLA